MPASFKMYNVLVPIEQNELISLTSLLENDKSSNTLLGQAAQVWEVNNQNLVAFFFFCWSFSKVISAWIADQWQKGARLSWAFAGMM